MANIESVRLPDNSVFNLKDAVSGYASKVMGATSGNLAGLDANGDLTDSGIAASVIGTKAPVDSIAPTEDGATASKAFAVGAYFYRGGDLCRCIAAISSGGTFTLNTNYRVISVAEGLELLTKDNIKVPLATTASDLDNVDGTYAFSVKRWEASTAHTPYTESVTVYGSGIAITYGESAGYRVQLALNVGENKLFIRSRANNTWSAWTAIS